MAKTGIAYLEVSWEWGEQEPTRYIHLRAAMPSLHAENVNAIHRIMQHAHDALKAEMARDRAKYSETEYLDGGLAAFDPAIRRERKRRLAYEWALKVVANTEARAAAIDSGKIEEQTEQDEAEEKADAARVTEMGRLRRELSAKPRRAEEGADEKAPDETETTWES